MLTALHLLRDQTLNPGWFGHPGSTTIYMLAAVQAATYGFWHVVGTYHGPPEFARAIYANPSIVFLPGRAFILLCGLITIILAMRIADRLSKRRSVVLLTGLLLALDPLHIRYSQIIRTDMHATIFVLLEILAAISIAQRGRQRDYVWAAVWLGLACATKWPSAAAAAAVFGAAALRYVEHPAERPLILRNLGLYCVAAPIALFFASPYLLLDLPTVLDNLRGEARTFHLGATGYGFLGNLGWYASGAFLTALGPAGLVFAAIGVTALRRSRIFLVTIVPVFVVFLAMICAQWLVWERWAVPLLPLLSLAAACGIVAHWDQARERFGARFGYATLLATALATLAPTIATARVFSRERAVETRQLATAWAREHVAPGESVTIEHLAFDVVDAPWRFLYPVGDEGCVDPKASLNSKIRYSTVGKWRGKRPVVDIGTVAADRLDTCRSDWAILSNWDRYRAEPDHFGKEMANYDHYVSEGGGKVVASFYPVPGKVGGRVVRVVRFMKREAR